MTTDQNYRDLVDPFVRAEEQAYARGRSEGIASGIFYTIVALIALGMLMVAMKVDAAEWTFEEARKPIRASERGATISVCHSVSVRMGWSCYFVMEAK